MPLFRVFGTDDDAGEIKLLLFFFITRDELSTRIYNIKTPSTRGRSSLSFFFLLAVEISTRGSSGCKRNANEFRS